MAAQHDPVKATAEQTSLLNWSPRTEHASCMGALVGVTEGPSVGLVVGIFRQEPHKTGHTLWSTPVSVEQFSGPKSSQNRRSYTP